MTAKEAKERAERNTPLAKEVAIIKNQIMAACDRGEFEIDYTFGGGYKTQVQVIAALMRDGYYVEEGQIDYHCLHISWMFPRI